MIDMMFGNKFLHFNEKYLFNEPDIYYNKDKFDSGEINLCFITGQSGSGKSTMANNMENNKIEKYELDDVIWNKERFTMENFKEYGDLIYTFFNTVGKKYYFSPEDVNNGTVEHYKGIYERDVVIDFVKYAINFARQHKNKKYIIEGVWLYMFIHPSLIKDYAVYIKGTSSLISAIRAIKRDYKSDQVKNKIKSAKCTLSLNMVSEKYVQKYRDYFTKLIS